MSDQRRIMLWCHPRTLSTAFCRVMVSRESCKVLMEPSVPTYYFGSERQGFFEVTRPPLFFPKEPLPLPNCTWKDYTAELSLPYEGHKEVFAKEMGIRMRKFLDAGNLDDVIPRDYVHVFLIRDPVKAIPSFLKLASDMKLMPTGYKEVFAKEMPYRVRKFLDTGTLDDVIPRDYVHAFLIRDPVKTIPSYLQLVYDLKQVPTGHQEVFAKEMPYRLRKFLDTKTLDDVIPCDYVHVFLIREPVKTIPSYLQLAKNHKALPTEEEDPVEFNTKRKFYEWPENWNQYMRKMYEWVVETKGYRPLVIDADDLQRDPESTLRRFCEFVQIDFQDTMVHWPPPPEDQAHLFSKYAGAWKKAGETEGVAPLSDKDTSKYPEPDEEVQVVIDRTMPIYKFLKEAEADKTFKV